MHALTPYIQLFQDHLNISLQEKATVSACCVLTPVMLAASTETNQLEHWLKCGSFIEYRPHQYKGTAYDHAALSDFGHRCWDISFAWPSVAAQLQTMHVARNMGFSLHACTSFKFLHAIQVPSGFVLIWPKACAVCIAVEGLVITYGLYRELRSVLWFAVPGNIQSIFPRVYIDKGPQRGTLSNEPDNAGLWLRERLGAAILFTFMLLRSQYHAWFGFM